MSVKKLNLVMTYPVKWSVRRIMNNFVQNFYDALGEEHFMQGFFYKYRDHTLTFRSDIGFDKEWLFYFGASSKRDAPESHAGGFGEGFKIAALTATRDYNIGVRMASRDWTLTVTTAAGEIAGVERSFLAYDIRTRPYMENTILTLTHVTSDFLKDAEAAVHDFLYEGNPILGTCLVKTDSFAIYESEIEPVHEYAGALFASYEKRAFLPIPLIICNHTYRPDRDDRDRDPFDSYDTMECINEVFHMLTPDEAYRVLEHIRVIWNPKTKASRYRNLNWKKSIGILIDKIHYRYSLFCKFEKEYAPFLIIAEKNGNSPDKNRLKTAAAWFQNYPEKDQYQLVRKEFHKLGVRTICECCEKHNGFLVDRTPDPCEEGYIAILKEAAECILGDLLCLKQWPECRVLDNKNAPYMGYTRVNKENGDKNAYGMKVQFVAQYISMKAYLFHLECFPDAFTTYAHELLHQYGGDASSQFHRALALMNERILYHADHIRYYQKEWINYGKRWTN